MSEKRDQLDSSDKYQPMVTSVFSVVSGDGISETLPIPWAARTLGGELFPQISVDDVYAREASMRLGDGGRLWLKDKHSVYGILARTRIFRDIARAYLGHCPAGHVVNLGCGMSHYSQ